MKVKICGIMDQETALAAARYGADALGFVFAESKRKIEVEKAKQIIELLPETIMKVGVFVNETKEEIERIALQAGITHAQVHGDETPEFCASLSIPVIKAISVDKEKNLEYIKNFPCEFILLDGPKGKYHGGNGLVFDWTVLKDQDFAGKKIILAGGLNLENVQEAIKKTQPFMVDVSSGVETEGKKDLQKIKLFIENVKGSLIRGKIQ